MFLEHGISALISQTSGANQWWRRQMSARPTQAPHFPHVQYCAKEMQPKFGVFRFLFSRKFDEISPRNFVKAQRWAQNASDTRDWWRRGTMGRRKMRGEAPTVSPVFPFSPSFARKLSLKVRRLGARQAKCGVFSKARTFLLIIKYPLNVSKICVKNK